MNPFDRDVIGYKYWELKAGGGGRGSVFRRAAAEWAGLLLAQSISYARFDAWHLPTFFFFLSYE